MPIAVLAILAILGFVFWRRNRDKKARLAARKGEIEDYGFDPNAPDGAGGAGTSASAGLGVGALGDAGAAAAASEMRQTSYGDDDGTGYRGWGPTSALNSKRPGWGTETGAVVGAAAVAGAGAGAYYNQQRTNPNPYDAYPNQSGDGYYYPDEDDQVRGAPPVLPPKSYDRYDAGAGDGYGAPSTEYNQGESGAPIGVVNNEVQRQPSNASSRYSTVSTDENAGQSHQNSPRFPHSQGFPNTPSTGRLGRSTMGAGGTGYEGGEEGTGRYDAVNF